MLQTTILRFRQEGLAFQVNFVNPPPKDKASWITVSYGGPLAAADGSPVEGLKLAYVGPEGSYLLYPARWVSCERLRRQPLCRDVENHGPFG